MEKVIFTQEEEQRIQHEFDVLVEAYENSMHRQNTEIIKRAFLFAKQAHDGVRRLSGEPYILHPIAVAQIVVKEIGLGSTSVCSALLHDVVEDTDYTVEDIQGLFGDKIAHIVDGLTKISGGVFGDQASEQAENFRKLLLTMSDDIRVVLVKIADRLHNMRTLSAQPKDKQYKIAGETLYIYAPLAHRLGLFPIKSELENLSFKYEHPDTYKEIEDKLAAIKDNQLECFENFSQPIKEKLQAMGYEFTMRARIKSVYSIYKKMKNKGIPFEDVYDLMAVRIIFTPHEGLPEKDQCWMIYSAITEIYRPHPERIRDWISTPKANGYEALHITVMASNGQWIEVQIRSKRMNEIAERGLAAHWKYKTGERGENELDKWLRTIKEILDNPEPNAIEFLDTFKLNLFAREVFVFTPGGDIKTMPQGATALDLAFQLHTQLGEHCIGAKINHELQPMSYELKGGDQVEILTSPSQHPQQEWLSMVTTAKAQSALRQYFRREERAQIRKGEKLFNDALVMFNATEQHDTALQRTLNYYHLIQPSELYLQIGQGYIPLDNLQQIIFPKKKSIWKRLNPFSSDDETATNTVVNTTEQTTTKNKTRKIVLTDEGLGKQYVLADCCHPIPGDEVFGFVDEKGLVHIHMIDCPEALKIKSEKGKQLCEASWNTHRVQSFVERIAIRGIDKFGVLAKVIAVVATEFHINLRKIHIESEDGIFHGEMELYVYDKKELQELFKALIQMPDIVSAYRLSNPNNNITINQNNNQIVSQSLR